MIKLKKGIFLSPPSFFVFYILASGLAIMGFRFILPGKPVPLEYFSTSWRLIQGFLEYISFFPALALTSLVIPFGFIIKTHDKDKPSPPEFLQSLKLNIFTVIIAAMVYGFLSFLALPIAESFESDLVFKGRLYLLAKERAEENIAIGEWDDAVQLISICEIIWPEGPGHEKIITEAEIHTSADRMKTIRLPELPEAGGSEPVNVAEALLLAETALNEERYFDAYWLASLGGRLSIPGSPEEAAARRLAGRAWSGVNSLAPSARETLAYTAYRLKREGHEAMTGEEWIRAYYLFRELIDLTPNDPDARKYLELSENGLRQAAFFIDEMEMAVNGILTGSVFSFPFESGRLVIRISSLSTSTDSVYGMGIEAMAFDREGRHLWSMEAPYAKILPLHLESRPSVSFLLRALSRTDPTARWEPEITGKEQYSRSNAELVLPISWDSFLLLLSMRRGISTLSLAELKAAAENLGAYGYLPQVFEAELLRYFINPLFMLPLGITAIALGWRYRAQKRPRYMAIPMLGILPTVFHGATFFSRSWFNNLGILAVFSFGFNTSAVFFAIVMALLFVISLILLAASR